MVNPKSLFLRRILAHVSQVLSILCIQQSRGINLVTNASDRNLINIIIYGALELSYIFNCTANCMMADGRSALGTTFTTIAGAFGMLSALAGFYMLGHDLCQDALPFEIPLFPTSRLFLNTHGRGRRRS